MFCHKCGAQIAEGAAFCQKCGAKVMPAEGELHPTPQATDEQSKPSSKETAKQPPAAPTKAGTSMNLLEVLIKVGAVALPFLAVYALIATIVGFPVNRVFAAVLLILGFLGAVSRALSGLFRKSKILTYGLLGLAAILSIVVLGALMRASQSEDTPPNNSNLMSSDGRIVLNNTQYFDDISFGNIEVTLDYVQFTDRLEDAWTGEYIYPDEGFVFLWAALTLENTGTTNSTLPTAWNTLVYDGSYEFRNYTSVGDLIDIPPLSAPIEGAIIFMVPTNVMASDKSLVLNINNGAGKAVISYTVRPGDKLLGDLSNDALEAENYRPPANENTANPPAGTGPSMNELLVSGYPIYELLGAPIDSVVSVWGAPLNIDGNWGIYYQYDGIGFSVDNHEIVYGATMFPDMCSLNGISLDKSRSELIEILGTPTSEGYYDDPDAFDTYYMLYEGFYGESNLIIDLYDDTAVWLYIGDYEI